MIDTDIIIWLLRGNEEIKEKFKKIVGENKGIIFITPIQITEIYAGLREKEKIETEIFLDSFNCLAIDKKIGEIAGSFINLYAKAHNLTIADALIGAMTKINSLKLWTLNKKHYPMIKPDEFLEI
ncbi:MAG: type II toxin-antitoxin system VapC family toxin [bacterium]